MVLFQGHLVRAPKQFISLPPSDDDKLEKRLGELLSGLPDELQQKLSGVDRVLFLPQKSCIPRKAVRYLSEAKKAWLAKKASLAIE